jgi:hypothetical protein
MKHLILSADLFSFIRDEFDEDFSVDDLVMPNGLRSRLENWYFRYRPIIAMNEAQRADARDLISSLDKEGLVLARELMVESDCKVLYYSEGLLRYLP